MKKMLFSNFLVLLIAIAPSIAYSATTSVSNVSQLQAAVNSASAGDIINLNDGTYSNFVLTISKSGTSGNYITVKAKNGGNVKFKGTVGIKITGNYVRVAGIDFNGATIPDSENLIEISGSYNIIEDINVNNVSNGSHSKHRYIMFTSTARNNTINRCWFVKGTQHGIVVYGDYKGGEAAYNNTIKNSYFKAQRQPDNGGSAIRLGTGGQSPYIDGSTSILNNLFDHYDGENEIISLKSRNNLVDGNTFTNCYGQVTCRHYKNNTISNNFFITTESRPDGDCVAVWGEDHKITNNYFHNTKTRFTTGGAISLVAGDTETEPTYKHEAVVNVLIKDNIIYEPNSQNHAIAFGDYYQKGSSSRTIMPRDVTVTGNYIYSTSNAKQIYYHKAVQNISYSGNKIFGNVGISPVPGGINSTNPNLVKDSHGIWRKDGKGPAGNPLKQANVGPNWMGNNSGGGNPDDTQAPTVPSGLSTSNIEKTSIGLSWSASSDNVGVTAYEVLQNGSAVKSVSGTSTILSGLSCGTSYTFRVQAKDAAGNTSTASSGKSASTSACDNGGGSGDTNTETFSNMTQTTWGSSTFTGDNGFVWNIVAAKGSSGNVGNSKDIYFRSGKTGVKSGTITGGISSFTMKCKNINGSDHKLQLLINGVVKGSSLNNSTSVYNFAVNNINVDGNITIEIKNTSSTAEPNHIAIDDITWTSYESGGGAGDTEAPSAPGSLATSNITQTSVSISWNASSDNVGVTAYEVLQNGSAVKSVSGTSTTLSGLSCGTSYTFKVKAKDVAGNTSAASSGKTVSTSICSGTINPVIEVLTATDDAYLQGSTRYNNTLIRIEAGRRVGYLKFDLSGISGNITSAKLKLKCNGDGGNGTIMIEKGNSNNWTEANLSSSNKPIANGQLGSINNTYSIGATYTWDLTASALSGSSDLSLIVTQITGNDVAFASKENSAGSAQLEITYVPLRSAEEEFASTSSLDHVKAYPNPFADNIIVEFGDSPINQLSIIDVEGSVIYQNKNLDNSSELNISLADLQINAGVYFLQLVSDSHVKTIKLIKE